LRRRGQAATPEIGKAVGSRNPPTFFRFCPCWQEGNLSLLVAFLVREAWRRLSGLATGPNALEHPRQQTAVGSESLRGGEDSRVRVLGLK
jgi:hypothetical protein